MAICRLMVFTFNSSAARNDCLNYLFCNRDDPNKNGSTPMLLASQNIGRGGSGSADARNAASAAAARRCPSRVRRSTDSGVSM